MTRTIRALTLIILASAVSSCNLGDELESITEFKSSKKIWIFSQFNVQRTNNQIEDYFYFGQINESLYQKIKSQQTKSGFISLENVRYWTNDDIIEEYSDDMNTGEILFRIEDIQKLEVLKKEPEIGYKYTDDTEQQSSTEAETTK